jgi:cysteine-rich repeat protein
MQHLRLVAPATGGRDAMVPEIRRCTSVLGLLLTVAAAAPAAAAIDLNGSFFGGPPGVVCRVDVTQAGAALSALETCLSLPPCALTGTIDTSSGAFALSGTCIDGGGVPFEYHLVATASADSYSYSGTNVGLTITATRCGDGAVQGPETCDDGNQNPSDCCNACQPRVSECDLDANPCTVDMCSGTGICVSTSLAPAGTICGQAANPCAPPLCDGAGTCAPTNRPAGAGCSADDDPCTQEQCDGAGHCDVVGTTTCGPGEWCDPNDPPGDPAGRCLMNCPGPCDGCSTCDNVLGQCVGDPVPDAACDGGVDPGSKLALRDYAEADRDRLKWKWGKTLLAGTPSTLFGDPTAPAGNPDLDPRVCVYLLPAGDPPVTLGRLDAIAGPLWSGRSSGFRFASAAPTGRAKLDLSVQPAGRVKIAANGRGIPTVLSVLPLVSIPPPVGDVLVQLRNANGACQEDRFPASRVTFTPDGRVKAAAK